MPRESKRAEDPSVQKWGRDLSRGSGKVAEGEPGRRAAEDPRSVLISPVVDADSEDRSVEIRSNGALGRSYFAVLPPAVPSSGVEGLDLGPACQPERGITRGSGPSTREGKPGPEGRREGLRVSRRRSSSGRQTDQPPPTPWGCEWRQADNGWNLWRCWSERESPTSPRVRRSRYAGFLSNDGWEVLKGYDYETFLAILGQRLRRYGKR